MHIMVDLETLSTRTNAHIVAIGAVAFNNTNVVDKYYQAIRLENNDKFHIDMGTLQWWITQSEEAREVFKDEYTAPLNVALVTFSKFFDKHQAETLWGNGAAFDNVILRNAYETIGIVPPWQHWQDRCYRTMKNLHPIVKMERKGTHHNALDDALSQTEHLLDIFKYAGV
jgi:DNA polymerase III epsilon subunit-like protein